MAKYNLSGYAGSSFSLTFTVKSCGGGNLSLSGYSIRSAIREKLSASTGIAEFVSSIIIPESGICNISMNATGTAALPPGVLLYDVEVQNSGGLNVLKPINGYFIVYPQVSW